MTASGLTFLPWLRGGLTGAIAAADDSPALTNRAAVPLALALNGQPVDSPAAQVLGPGDVLGIADRQVLRLDPPDLTTGHETERWPSIEFDEPALPWLFTPAAPAANRLRPWITLVVVREGDGVELTPGTQPGTTRLRVAAPANVETELGDPARAWAYAHVQVAGPLAGPAGAAPDAPDLGTVLAKWPERALARLVCARPLEPACRYLACVVPTFEAGRVAGLGGQVDPAALVQPAWAPDAPAVELPVYVWWQFTTAAERGDFATLAGQLTGQPCPESVGLRPLQVSEGQLQEALVLPGLFTAPGAVLEPGPSGALRTLLAAELSPSRVPPPVYGSIATGRGVGDGGWLAELNLDPRWRVAAGLGAEVVRRTQEDLVAAVVAEIGDANAVNALLDRARLARAASQQIYERHVKPLDDHTLLQVAAPAGRSLLTPLTLHGEIAAAPVPDGVLDPALRKLARPTGPDGPVGGIDPATIPPDLPTRLRAELDPEPTITQRTLERVRAPTPSSGADPLADRELSPTLRAPMYEALAAVAPDFVLSQADAIPPDSVVLLEVNRAAVTAFMCGLNHELARELVWRGVPVDRRATLLSTFWDGRGQPGADPEFAPIDQWPAGDRLAEIAGPPMTVLAMRGELLRRYPRTRVTAVRAKPGGDGPVDDEAATGNTLEPVFTGFLTPDLRFFGFAVDESSLGSSQTDAGWFFALQEQVTEAGFHALPGAGSAAAGAASGTTAAEIASGAWRPPVRVLIRADELLP
jgi:hypothetical protein